MIKNSEEVDRAEREYERTHPLTLEQKYQILEGLYHLAKDAGHFNPKDMSLDDDDVKLAKALNANLSPPFRENCPGS
jgi:hypothetical protein